MTLSIFMQLVVVLAAIWMGSRHSALGLGLWGAVGLLVLVVAFGVSPTSPPVDVMLIILAVIMAASVMEAAGGIDFLGAVQRLARQRGDAAVADADVAHRVQPVGRVHHAAVADDQVVIFSTGRGASGDAGQQAGQQGEQRG